MRYIWLLLTVVLVFLCVGALAEEIEPIPTPTPVPVFDNATGPITSATWETSVLAKVNNTQPVRFISHAWNASAWYWDFGNGQTSDLENPVIVYTHSGCFNVSLTAWNSKNTASYTILDHLSMRLGGSS